MLRPAVTVLLCACLGAPAAADCLPDGSGYLVARLRGDLEADLDWRAAALECTGMPRPDGRGLRLHFSGTLPDGSALAFVFAPPRLAEGSDEEAVPVNLTILHDGRIYGTRGGGRCLLDEVVQRSMNGPVTGPRVWAVEARGFCTEPARALGEGGSLLLTRFDFRGRVSYPDEAEEMPGPATAAGAGS